MRLAVPRDTNKVSSDHQAFARQGHMLHIFVQDIYINDLINTLQIIFGVIYKMPEQQDIFHQHVFYIC